MTDKVKPDKETRCKAVHTAFTLLQATDDLPGLVQRIEQTVLAEFEKMQDNVLMYTWRTGYETYDTLLTFNTRLAFQNPTSVKDVKRAIDDVQLKEMKAGIPNLLAAAPSVSPNLENTWDGLMLTSCIAAYGPQHEGINKAPGVEGEYLYDGDGCRKSPLTQTLEQYGASLIRMLSIEEDVNDVAVLSKRSSGDDSTATFYIFVQVDTPTRAKWWSLADAIVAKSS
eukprot:20895-Heterococcus_DN1.PRE.1